MAAISSVPPAVHQKLLPAHRRHHPGHRRFGATPFTGYVVAGETSTFGLPGEPGPTASGISTAVPCIAIRNDATLGHWFVLEELQRRVRVVQCDFGPAEGLGRECPPRCRAIDESGALVEELGFSQTDYPTDEAWGVARELQ